MTDVQDVAFPSTEEDAVGVLQRTFMRRASDALLRDVFDRALRDSRSAGEGRGVVVVGPSGAGKTTMIGRCLDRHPGIGRTKGEENLLVRVTVPGPCTLAELGRVVAAAVGYPLAVARPDYIWHKVRSMIAEEGVAAIYLDEIQNISDTINAVEAQKLRNLLKTLMNDPVHPVALLMAGQPSAAAFLHGDRQVSRRISFVALQPLRSGEFGEVARAIRHLASRIGVHVAPGVAEAVAPRLVHAACRQFGTAIEIARAAIVRAWAQGGRRLEVGHFADVHAEATGNASFANPFLADDWMSLDPAAVLVTEPEQLVGPEPEPPARRRRGSRAGALR